MNHDMFESDCAPVLVLGLGNLLMKDDGFGLALLDELRQAVPTDADLEFCDGGTQGLALGARIAGRQAILVLDAVKMGAAPGTLHRIDDPFSAAPPQGASAHEANAGELLRAAALIGDLPERVVILGVEPADTRLGIGLTEPVRTALPGAREQAKALLAEMRGSVQPAAGSC